MSEAVIACILVAHFIGDFVCQTDWMATNKSRSFHALGVHVVAYTASALIPVMAAAGSASGATTSAMVAWCLSNAAAHFAQDAVTSRINARLWQSGQRHWFFVGIGADQLLHYLTLFATAVWWLA